VYLFIYMFIYYARRQQITQHHSYKDRKKHKKLKTKIHKNQGHKMADFFCRPIVADHLHMLSDIKLQYLPWQDYRDI